jgi:hypothetical protein
VGTSPHESPDVPRRIIRRSPVALARFICLPDRYRSAVDQAIASLERIEDPSPYLGTMHLVRQPAKLQEIEAAEGTRWHWVAATGPVPPETDQPESEEILVALVLVEEPRGLSPLPMWRVISIASAGKGGDFNPRLLSELKLGLLEHGAFWAADESARADPLT